MFPSSAAILRGNCLSEFTTCNTDRRFLNMVFLFCIFPQQPKVSQPNGNQPGAFRSNLKGRSPKRCLPKRSLFLLAWEEEAKGKTLTKKRGFLPFGLRKQTRSRLLPNFRVQLLRRRSDFGPRSNIGVFMGGTGGVVSEFGQVPKAPGTAGEIWWTGPGGDVRLRRGGVFLRAKTPSPTKILGKYFWTAKGGHGSKPMVPFWDRRATHFSLC